MRTVLAALALLIAGATQDDAAKKDAAKKDLGRLQGVWIMHAMEVNGMNVAPERLQSAVLTVKGDRYEVRVKDKVTNTFTLSLHPAKDPKELDMTALEGANKDKVHRAIYKIEQDTFTFCRGLAPDQERPNQFATWPETNYFVVTWKRK
jgi:uncharacterized protein (TIGR03067 family)